MHIDGGPKVFFAYLGAVMKFSAGLSDQGLRAAFLASIEEAAKVMQAAEGAKGFSTIQAIRVQAEQRAAGDTQRADAHLAVDACETERDGVVAQRGRLLIGEDEDAARHRGRDDAHHAPNLPLQRSRLRLDRIRRRGLLRGALESADARDPPGRIELSARRREGAGRDAASIALYSEGVDHRGGARHRRRRNAPDLQRRRHRAVKQHAAIGALNDDVAERRRGRRRQQRRAEQAGSRQRREQRGAAIGGRDALGSSHADGGIGDRRCRRTRRGRRLRGPWDGERGLRERARAVHHTLKVHIKAKNERGARSAEASESPSTA